MSTLNNVWVLGETPESYAPLTAVARRLGDRVEALVIGDVDAAQLVKGCGADAVRLAAVPEGGMAEDCVQAVIGAIEASAPDAVLFSASKRMRLAAARIAAAFGTRVLNDATRIWVDDGGCLAAERMVYGGKAFAEERVASGLAVALLSEGLLASEPAGDAGDAAIEKIAVAAEPTAVRLIETKPRTVESVNLAAARRVVSVGRGIERKEDLRMIAELAQALEAETGCTRSIAESENWMSRERYIDRKSVV